MKTRFSNHVFGLFFFIISFPLLAQHNGILKGKVTIDGKNEVLMGANVYWLNQYTGTITNEKGEFSINRVENYNQLIISYVGFVNDTVDVSGKEFLAISLKASQTLDELEVVHRQKTTQISMLDPIKTENVGEKELQKAACCNLSESFETNPSVDVSFTDAVTGTRQIQMLGLAGSNTQITRENMPDARGLTAIYGLTFVPGPWVESLQLIKGTGSVVNGFESIAGQINVELRKPESATPLYLNVYGNEGGRIETNLNWAHRFKGENKWSTALLMHYKNSSVEQDRNGDGFLDNPIGNHLIGLNRWKYIGTNGLRFQFGVKGTYMDQIGGQTGFDTEKNGTNKDQWGMNQVINRWEGWGKIGKVFEAVPWKTVGLQFSGAVHEQESFFGTNRYNAIQNTGYANLLYQSIFWNTNHNFKTGASLQYDEYDETLNETSFNRTEIVPGAFFEYAYNYSEKLNLVAGIRGDYHNLFGFFLTPRIHARYAITENTVMRVNAGRGQRTANIISENYGLLASSRQLIIKGDHSNKPYGLNPEVAYSYGINLTQRFRLNYKEGILSVDFYRTDFQNQIIVDLDQSPQQAVFYNLRGLSYSNSFQVQVDYEVVNRLALRLAYRWNDVKTTYYNSGLLEKPLVAKHRAFINMGYETKNLWKFDCTFNWQGSQRLPQTTDNPVAYRLPQNSPHFVLLNAQLSKAWKEKLEIYLGVENLLNYKQKNPILSADKPFEKYFDSSMVWGPVFGRNMYVGIRFKVSKS